MVGLRQQTNVRVVSWRAYVCVFLPFKHIEIENNSFCFPDHGQHLLPQHLQAQLSLGGAVGEASLLHVVHLVVRELAASLRREKTNNDDEM